MDFTQEHPMDAVAGSGSEELNSARRMRRDDRPPLLFAAVSAVFLAAFLIVMGWTVHRVASLRTEVALIEISQNRLVKKINRLGNKVNVLQKEVNDLVVDIVEIRELLRYRSP